MADQSHLDQRYFVDQTIYNCPFCNRRHVSYSVYASVEFDWTDKKRCYAYFVRCHSCNNASMHLAFNKIPIVSIGSAGTSYRWRFNKAEGIDAGDFLDNAFFYSVPTSFFVLDERVPKVRYCQMLCMDN